MLFRSAESMISLASEHTTTGSGAAAGQEGPSTPKPELTDFQLRRRRAAKLTQFFGVQYRELINDVLDSLEHGLEHEQKRGTLQAGEIAVCPHLLPLSYVPFANCGRYIGFARTPPRTQSQT